MTEKTKTVAEKLMEQSHQEVDAVVLRTQAQYAAHGVPIKPKDRKAK